MLNILRICKNEIQEPSPLSSSYLSLPLARRLVERAFDKRERELRSKGLTEDDFDLLTLQWEKEDLLDEVDKVAKKRKKNPMAAQRFVYQQPHDPEGILHLFSTLRREVFRRVDPWAVVIERGDSSFAGEILVGQVIQQSEPFFAELLRCSLFATAAFLERPAQDIVSQLPPGMEEFGFSAEDVFSPEEIKPEEPLSPQDEQLRLLEQRYNTVAQLYDASRFFRPDVLKRFNLDRLWYFEKKEKPRLRILDRAWYVYLPHIQDKTEAAKVAKLLRKLIKKRDLTADLPQLSQRTLFVGFPGGLFELEEEEWKPKRPSLKDEKDRLAIRAKNYFGGKARVDGKEGDWTLVIRPRANIVHVTGSAEIYIPFSTIEEGRNRLDEKIEQVEQFFEQKKKPTEDDLERFLDRWRVVRDAEFQKLYGHPADDEINYTTGKKYWKIYKANPPGSDYRSIVAFVDKDTGDVYKAAGSKAPAKHVRGSIFDPNVENFMGRYGPHTFR